MKDAFWIFANLGLAEAIVCNALFRHYAKLHEDKLVVIPCWEANLANIQWMLSDVPNIFFYPIETEQQLLTCKASINKNDKLCLGFYYEPLNIHHEGFGVFTGLAAFNPVLWDSEFYRQGGLDPELKWEGFKLPEIRKNWEELKRPFIVIHDDRKRGFEIKTELMPRSPINLNWTRTLKNSCEAIYASDEIHVIDSSMLNLSDLMPTPYCKRFVFHRYARKGLPPQLRKAWEIID